MDVDFSRTSDDEHGPDSESAPVSERCALGHFVVCVVILRCYHLHGPYAFICLCPRSLPTRRPSNRLPSKGTHKSLLYLPTVQWLLNRHCCSPFALSANVLVPWSPFAGQLRCSNLPVVCRGPSFLHCLRRFHRHRFPTSHLTTGTSYCIPRSVDLLPMCTH